MSQDRSYICFKCLETLLKCLETFSKCLEMFLRSLGRHFWRHFGNVSRHIFGKRESHLMKYWRYTSIKQNDILVPKTGTTLYHTFLPYQIIHMQNFLMIPNKLRSAADQQSTGTVQYLVFFHVTSQCMQMS